MGISENFYSVTKCEVEPGTSRIWDEFEMKIDCETRGLLDK